MKKILLTLLVFAALFGANTVFAENLIQGGDFETTGDLVYSDSTITGISGSSIDKAYASAAIVGYSDVAHSGTHSLEISQKTYYPLTFKTTLQKGKAYKFAAYVKLKDNSGATKGNLLVATQKSTVVSGNGLYILEDGAVKYDAGYAYETSAPLTEFSKTSWTKFEKTFYVSDSVSTDTVTAYIGIKSRTVDKTFNYYIDDVSLEEVEPQITIADGYSRVYAAKGKDMVYTYKAESVFVSQEGIAWTVEGDATAVSISGGSLTVGEAASGTITITAASTDIVTGAAVACTKEVEIVPFTADNITVNVNGKALDGFSVENENYVYEYRGETIPTVTAIGNQSIIKNENTVFVNDTTKTYDIILKKLPDFNENLFYDGGFEEGVVNSAYADLDVKSGTTGITTEKDKVHSGKYALKVGANQYTTLNLKTKVQGGKLYRVSMWIKNSATSGTNSFFPCFYKSGISEDSLWKTQADFVKYYHESDKKFIQGFIWGGNNSRTITVKNQWQLVERLIYIEDDVDEITLSFGFTMYSDTSAEYYVDDVSIYELDMSQLGDAYMGAVYRTANGEMAKTITDADHIEIILYNPDQTTEGTNLLFAEYENGRLLKLTKEQFTTSTDVVEIINKPLTLQQGTNSMSILAWDTGFVPDIKSVNIK